MPSPATISVFDATFDYTFGNRLPSVPPIAVNACRLPGVNLHWLSHRGWCSFLFQGNADQDIEIKSLGPLQRSKIMLDTQRQGTPVMVARAGLLTPARAAVIGSILISPAVYLLAESSDGIIRAIQMRIDEGSYPIARDAQARISIEFKFTLPFLTAQRA